MDEYVSRPFWPAKADYNTQILHNHVQIKESY